MRKRSRKYLLILIYVFLLVGIVFLMGITRSCGNWAKGMVEGNSGGDTIDIAMIYGPAGIYIYNDSLGGINSDIARRFCEETGIPVKIWPVADAEDAMNKIEDRSFDILASMPLDNNLKNRFLTSESIFLDRLVLIQLLDSVNADKKISSSLDLDGVTVAVPSGSPAKQRLENLEKEIGGHINIIEEKETSDELLTLQVAAGEIPFAVVNERTAERIARHYPLLSYDNPISFTQFQIWIFNPEDSALYKKFSEWFEIYRTTDSYRELLKRY